VLTLACCACRGTHVGILLHATCIMHVNIRRKKERVPGVVEPQEALWPCTLENQAHHGAWHRTCCLGSRRSLEGSSKANCFGGWEAGCVAGSAFLAHRHMHPILYLGGATRVQEVQVEWFLRAGAVALETSLAVPGSTWERPSAKTQQTAFTGKTCLHAGTACRSEARNCAALISILAHSLTHSPTPLTYSSTSFKQSDPARLSPDQTRPVQSSLSLSPAQPAVDLSFSHFYPFS